MHGDADRSLFGNKQQSNTDKLFSDVQLIKHYIVTKDDKEDGVTKCEKANPQRAPAGISTGQSSTYSSHKQSSGRNQAMGLLTCFQY